MEAVLLQPEAIVDHIVVCDENEYYQFAEDQGKVARRCELEDVRQLLARCGGFLTKAGGSACNTAKALAAFGHGAALVRGIAPPPAGFDHRWHVPPPPASPPLQVGAVGSDEWGQLVLSSLQRSKVDTSNLVAVDAATGAPPAAPPTSPALRRRALLPAPCSRSVRAARPLTPSPPPHPAQGARPS
jgi:hypothetical protein